MAEDSPRWSKSIDLGVPLGSGSHQSHPGDSEEQTALRTTRPDASSQPPKASAWHT